MEDFEKLERLLLNKSYQELTPLEEHWLSAQGIGREVFQQQKEVLRTMKQYLGRTVPPVPSADLFRDALAVRKRENSRHWKGMWLVATVMLVVGCILGRWFGGGEEIIIKEGLKALSVREIIRDTVFVESPQVLDPPRVIYRDIIQRDTIYISMPIANSISSEELARDVLSVTSVKEMPELSRNAKETEALLKILVQVY